VPCALSYTNYKNLNTLFNRNALFWHAVGDFYLSLDWKKFH
jgi:hypothetical protein